VVTDATKKLREPVAYILLAFTGLVALAFLFRLFVGSAGFTNAAGLVQARITPPEIQGVVLLVALVAAVWLVNDAGERTPNARLVTLGALSITGLLVLLGLIGAFAGFNETATAGVKIVAFIFALGGLALYGAAGLYILKTFQGLPAPVRAPKAGPQGQFAGQQGQYGGAQGQYPQQGQYGQQGAQQGQYGAQQGQYGAQQGQYGQTEQGGQYGAYGAGAAGGVAAGAAGGYAAAQGGEQQWPQEQSWNQGSGEQQAAWTASDAEGQPQAETPAAQPAAQPAEQAWSADGQAAEPTQQWSPEGQQWPAQEQGQQWPQEQQQWGGADSGQQWGAGQEQYGQPAQQEWPAQEAAQPEQQAWQPEAQAWQGEQAPAAEQPAEAAPEAVDETRVEPPVSDAPKDEDGQPQQGQGGQQGWWSQPS
jgi:hypothetical protein